MATAKDGSGPRWCERLMGWEPARYWLVVSWWWPFCLGARGERVAVWVSVMVFAGAAWCGWWWGSGSVVAAAVVSAAATGALLALMVGVVAWLRARRHEAREGAGYWSLQGSHGWACVQVYLGGQGERVVEAMVSVGSWRKILRPDSKSRRVNRCPAGEGRAATMTAAVTVAADAQRPAQRLTLRARTPELEAFYRSHGFRVDDPGARPPRAMTRHPQTAGREVAGTVHAGL